MTVAKKLTRDVSQKPDQQLAKKELHLGKKTDPLQTLILDDIV